MSDNKFESVLVCLFWELMLLASGVRCLDYWESYIRVIGVAFILIASTLIVTTIMVPVLKSRS